MTVCRPCLACFLPGAGVAQMGGGFAYRVPDRQFFTFRPAVCPGAVGMKGACYKPDEERRVWPVVAVAESLT